MRLSGSFFRRLENEWGRLIDFRWPLCSLFPPLYNPFFEQLTPPDKARRLSAHSRKRTRRKNNSSTTHEQHDLPSSTVVVKVVVRRRQRQSADRGRAARPRVDRPRDQRRRRADPRVARHGADARAARVRQGGAGPRRRWRASHFCFLFDGNRSIGAVVVFSTSKNERERERERKTQTKIFRREKTTNRDQTAFPIFFFLFTFAHKKHTRTHTRKESKRLLRVES